MAGSTCSKVFWHRSLASISYVWNCLGILASLRLAKSSLWNSWTSCKCGDGFESAATRRLGPLYFCSWRAGRCSPLAITVVFSFSFSSSYRVILFLTFCLTLGLFRSVFSFQIFSVFLNVFLLLISGLIPL